MFNHIHISLPFSLKLKGMLLILAASASLYARAQLVIGGNVYGGGDMGDVGGSTTVHVLSGDMEGSVFGGARMANIKGNAFVNIDGENEGQDGYILIDRVYGGNDIAGKIGTGIVPATLHDAETDSIDNTWNAFVHISNAKTDQDTTLSDGTTVKTDLKQIYIGQLFGGGNGEYIYTSQTEDEITTYFALSVKDSTVIASDTAKLTSPNLAKTYVDLHGGSIVYAYGGGNNATITEKTVICVENASNVVNQIVDDRIESYTSFEGNMLTTARFKQMGINTGFSFPSSDEFQIGRLFGGNNVAEMAIRPTWHLESGKVRNVYSGGNRGNMTNPEGLLLTIPDSSTIIIDNLYGGCRMADVRPQLDGEDVQIIQIKEEDMSFPAGLSARLVVFGGDVNNVYGGNDVTGQVYGGNAVGIYTSIRGSVYGGGNGSYPYTDNEKLKNHDIYGDVYYNPDTVLAKAGITIPEGDEGLKSVTALNAFRPDAEQVSIHLIGVKTVKDSHNQDSIVPTIIGGSVYLGGNSATLKPQILDDKPRIELKIGSNVIADKVFMGNNGENMVDTTILKLYAGNIDTLDFSKINLKDPAQFATYMEGAAMSYTPKITFDGQEGVDRFVYKDYSSYFGSFYWGGNVGSMTYEGTNEINMSARVIVYDKVVGGCNNANVDSTRYNAAYKGGILGAKTEIAQDGLFRVNKDDVTSQIQNRLVMDVNGLKFEPKRWDDEFTKLSDGTVLSKGKKYYTSDLRSTEFVSNGQDTVDYASQTYFYELTKPGTKLIWNTAVWDDETDAGFIATDTATEANDDGRRLLSGNLYGGCYNSGIVNGNVVININNDLFDKDNLFADAIESDENPDSLIIDPDGERRTGVILDNQANDINTVGLSVFGGGYGENTEIWGSTNINHYKGYTLQIYGGGYAGVVGKRNADDELEYDSAFSTMVNLASASPVNAQTGQAPAGLAEAEFLYGAGNEGDVAGNSYVYLGNGRIYDAFGGASDADILGHTEVYIGRQINKDSTLTSGFPWIRDIVYGGNDFGGRIFGSADLSSHVSDFALPKVYGYDSDTKTAEVLNASAYVEYRQGRVDTIFGGSYGNYPYDDPEYYVDGQQVDMPYLHNAFVNLHPDDVPNNVLKAIFGGSTGYPGNRDGDKAQDRSYVLVDIADTTINNFRLTEIYGSGSYSGMGMRKTVLPMERPAAGASDSEQQAYNTYLAQLDSISSIVDLISGRVGAAYGGSYNEGLTRRTVVNVPQGSKIDIGSIFGGAYGNVTLDPCDVYEANVNYNSSDAWLTYSPRRYDTNAKDSVGNDILTGNIYGGNNNRRRTVYGKVNINSRVNQYNYKYGKSTATIFGAGRGENTWSEYTEVNLDTNAEVYEVYGGGEDGLVINAPSIQRYINTGYVIQGLDSVSNPQWIASWTIDNGYELDRVYDGSDSTYVKNIYTNLDNPLVTPRTEYDGGRYNTNVIINSGAQVYGYAYGGGLGHDDKAGSGDVYGTTYLALLGGSVSKDMYAAGTTGGVYDAFGVGHKTSQNPYGFTAGTTAYIEGGTTRNIYGGGWKGNVGDDLHPGESNVILGIRRELAGADTTFLKGDPAIQRNAYAGGEGGAVLGTANIILNNGHIGYLHLDDNQALSDTGSIITSPGALARYVPKIDDETYVQDHRWKGKDRLEDYGNIYGSGYDDQSSVDTSNVILYGGIVRNSVFGGGEVATVGRGSSTEVSGKVNIDHPGEAHVYMYGGNVLRNVFGGGKGYNKLGYGTTHNLGTNGYVFGKTQVNIHGGVIGTPEGLAKGYGNVFGGGDQGFVFSASGKKSGERYDNGDEGYYYEYNGSSFVLSGSGEKIMTEDCAVLIEPWLQDTATGSLAIGDSVFRQWDYVPTSYLNLLPKKAKNANWNNDWQKLDAGNKDQERGVIIYNAVFAGGNVSSGTDLSAHITTVYGNATAAINDVYHRDLVTIGTGRVGGLYGDGNLTFVDGYRELNITNYGTDFYHIDENIGIDSYEALPDREKAYYELKYTCKTECSDNDSTLYKVGSTLSQEELLSLFAGRTTILNADMSTPNPDYWEKSGVLLRAPGRTLNTLQRADFCGVFGSRLVMQGARDRVVDVMDHTNYTINRVREVSLNKRKSNIAADSARYTSADLVSADSIGLYKDENAAYHGNYFGIYSVVNYLGALTSDVDFGDQNNNGAIRTSDNIDYATYRAPYNIGGQNYVYGQNGSTFYNWKKYHKTDRTRNNGNSYNQVALASGVYLELTNEKKKIEQEQESEEATTTTYDIRDKDWGIITGVIELDLINVSTGLGGGFVYAKNVHGTRSLTGKTQTTLSPLNDGAETNKRYKYAKAVATTNTNEWQSSGNFVHSTQTIIDDCYNITGRYHGEDSVPAHYWFIKGQIYVYDQYISAYTGTPNAYSETVNIPLTISAGANGKLKLLNVQPNLYAYYQVNNGTTTRPLTGTNKLVLNDIQYQLNDPISYWDWQKLSKAEQKLFVDSTYVVIDDCMIGDVAFKADTVLLKEQYKALKAGEPVVTQQKLVDGVEVNDTVDFDFLVRLTNNISHNTGYILTYNVDNPEVWNKWYTPIDSTPDKKKTSTDYSKLAADVKLKYNDGPTYRALSTGLYGQRNYSPAEIISKDIYDTYNTAYSRLSDTEKAALPEQATFERAFITNATVDANKISGNGTGLIHLQKGACLALSEYSTTSSWPDALDGKVAPAFICTSTIRLAEAEYITAGDVMDTAQIEAYKDTLNARIGRLTPGSSNIATLTAIRNDIDKYIVPAYYCTSDTIRPYGGNYYQQDQNYRALNAWSAMSEEDRSHFKFNYDALDLLIDSTYSKREGYKYQYDSEYGTFHEAKQNKATYSLTTPIDYEARYNGAEPLEFITDDGADSTATNGTVLTRTEFERLPNEQKHYAPIKIQNAGPYYVVNTEFTYLEPYAVGQTIEQSTYDNLPDSMKTNYITQLSGLSEYIGQRLYFCREGYTISNSTAIGQPVKDIKGITSGTTYNRGDSVPVGVIIAQGEQNDNTNCYTSLINKQTNFSIIGKAPVETSTLYVSRNSDIFDLSRDKIITVIYQYDYEESDESGNNITPISERHVLNIHLQFKSGIPAIDDITSPDIILPGTSISLNTPDVTPGAYEVIERGWELFEKPSYAESHINGINYLAADPLFWYQDGYYLAYYAKTYLGKTYSNAVPVSVANYHDLKEVMDDKDHHMYVDYDRTELKRDSKIYINDYSSADENGLDLLKDLFDLSLLDKNSTGVTDGKVTADGSLEGHSLLNNSIEQKIMNGVTVYKGVRGGTNLEFILRTDIDHSDSVWTPIGYETDECFNGTLHGDGYTITGLTNSLFQNLCGNVYNLGVTGTFSGAGIAETGTGYIENSWISTTSTDVKTSRPVFGNPSRTTSDKIQIVNSYYLENDTDAIKNGSYTKKIAEAENNEGYVDHGTPIRKPAQSFRNGEVAYNLNGFYLNRRYYDGIGQNDGKDYRYIDSENEYKLDTIYYPASTDAKYGNMDYIHERYADGDFRFAAGTTEIGDDYHQVFESSTDEKPIFAPIWPDDYIFFGQNLTFGYDDEKPHQSLPSHYYTTATTSNRVYRAPAYYGSSNMNVAYFNPDANLVSNFKNQDSVPAYPGMTAIDFTGHNDDDYYQGLSSANRFFSPLLDFSGLTSIRTDGQTKNLLAYSSIADAATTEVINNYFKEPDYHAYLANDGYESIRKISRDDSLRMHGHLVVMESDHSYHAVNDQFLVDKQDFNAPISYTMGTRSDYANLMWYQRTPEIFVRNAGTGWESISLPFTAKIVSTSNRGIITHFYEGSKIGHEYWLRTPDRMDPDDNTNTKILFKSLAKATKADKDAGNGADITYSNTFLWDYYYNRNSGRDANDDIYHEYYSGTREYKNYPFAAAAQPYLIGFPSERYYEFDLSGNFEAQNTANPTRPPKLDRQTVTFVSAEDIMIGVSDEDYETEVEVSDAAYKFKPTYQARELDGSETYLLNASGVAFKNDTATVKTVPFRAYFTSAAAPHTAQMRYDTRATALYLGYLGDQDDLEEVATQSGLYIYTQDMNIHIESTLEYPAEVTIMTVAGKLLKQFTIQPATKVSVPVNSRGVYIVNRQKIAVTK